MFPLLAILFFAGATGLGISYQGGSAGLAYAIVLLAILFGTVFAAVHHAEVIAELIGEPFGTLLLTLSVTIIEVALIVTLTNGDNPNPALARDTVFAVVMIVCNGLVGVCMLAGGLRFREQEFRISGTNVYLVVLVVLATITLVMPNYTRATPGPQYSETQLEFVSVVTIILYGVFLYTQTIRHRDYFVAGQGEGGNHAGHGHGRLLLVSFVLLVVSLLAVVLLAKKFSIVVEAGAALIGAPPAFSGLVVALLILLPESVAAIAAARANDLQKSINLALGSSLATIGLTVPAVAATTVILDKPLVLGLGPQETVLLVMTVLISMLSFGTGRTNVLFGLVHVIVFAVYVFLVFAP